MKCQHCAKPAVLHITEVLPQREFEERHYCGECAQHHLTQLGAPKQETAELSDPAELSEGRCDQCGIKFADFRNSGRLGCPKDYQVFRTELSALLDSIHGSTRHGGKRPKRRSAGLLRTVDLAKLKRQLQKAVNTEDYEEAARLRDEIRQVEGEMEKGGVASE